MAIDIMSQALETRVSESMYISRPSEGRHFQLLRVAASCVTACVHSFLSH